MNNQAERETGEATGKQTSLVLMTPTSKAPRVAPPLSTTASRGFTNHQGQHHVSVPRFLIAGELSRQLLPAAVRNQAIQFVEGIRERQRNQHHARTQDEPGHDVGLGQEDQLAPDPANQDNTH